MTKAKKTSDAKASRTELENVELDPDAWPKFEALVKSAAKMGHKPHAKASKPSTRKS